MPISDANLDLGAELSVRILHINKFGWPKGGSDVYALRTAERLAAVPHVTAGLWASRPEAAAPVTNYNVMIPDFHEAAGLREKLGAAAGVLWSAKAKRELAAVIDDFQPDVAHLHLYAHQFSSSIVSLLKERGVGTVATAHDYKLICPSYLAVRNGRDCFKCARRASVVAVRDKCLHGKTTWSALAVAEAELVRVRRLLPSVVIAPSRFMFERLERSWLKPHTTLLRISHAVDPSGATWVGDGGYLLYAGRLSREKGIDELITRADQLRLPLVVAGDGPEREGLAMLARGRDVEFVGHVQPIELAELRRRCLAQVIPSTWPENYPLTALEAAVDGVPLIVSGRGGLPELLEMGARGAAIRAPELSEWRNALAVVSAYVEGQGLEDLARVRRLFSWERHIAELLKAYSAARRGAREPARGSQAKSAARNDGLIHAYANPRDG